MGRVSLTYLWRQFYLPMKVSLNWLREYLPIDLEPERLGAVLTGTGLEVEGMEKVESIPGGLAGVIVGHVLTCAKHPNADRLSVTTVDVGGQEPLSIVCGAPNVAAGQHVLVATVGATLHPLEGEPFKIKKGKIRGETSAGMICAEDELGLGGDHDGIIVLEKPYAPGTAAREVYDLQEDYVYEIGLTPNRSDATNHLGVAFDVAAAVNTLNDTAIRVSRPDVSSFKEGTEKAFSVRVADASQAPRYAGLVIEGLSIAPSPDWLRRHLQAIGVRPINNVVDVTNFVLHELGQPLHAFDLDRIGGREIHVEKLPAGTPFLSLDGVERTLSADDLMICDGNHQPMCIAGVFGGAGSGVTDATTRVFFGVRPLRGGHDPAQQHAAYLADGCGAGIRKRQRPERDRIRPQKGGAFTAGGRRRAGGQSVTRPVSGTHRAPEDRDA